jgi:hypothetical protein
MVNSMSKNNMAALQSALKAKPEPIAVAREANKATTAAAAASYIAPSRAGKTNLTAYLSQDYKRNMRLIQAKTGRSLQTLIAEALNDLFVKYDVPAIDHE